MKAPFSNEEKRAKKKACAAKYYQKHREAILAKNKANHIRFHEQRLACGRKWRAKNKERKAATDRAYQIKNSQKLKAKAAQRYLGNVEKFRQERHDHYSKNKAAHAAVGKIYARSNPVKIRKIKARYRAKHKTEILEYYRANKIKALQASRKRKALKKKATVGDTSVMLKWERVWKSKSVVSCFWCMRNFSPSKCDVDHIEALSKGGKHSIENLCISCSSCNNRKYVKSKDEWNRHIENPVLF